MFLTEKMNSHPNNWTFRNEVILKKVAFRKSTVIYNILSELRESLVDRIFQEVIKPENEHRFPNYRKMYPELLKWYITLNYQLVASSVRSRDRSIIPIYAKEIAFKRYINGFKSQEVKDIMFLIGKIMKESLLTRPELKGSKRQVDDYIILTSQLAADEFEDAYEILEDHLPEQMDSIKDIAQLISIENLKRIVKQLEDFYCESLSNRLGREEVFDNCTFFVTLDSQND